MAYEAMNNAGARDARLIVILNDNDMSIAPPTGASRPISPASPRAAPICFGAISPSGSPSACRRVGNAAWHGWRSTPRHFWQGGAWFEELGFYYVGPIDGHDFHQLLPVLRNVRDAAEGPILVHVVTKKGKGYGPAEASDDKYHGVAKFNVVTGAQAKPEAKAPSYTRVFADSSHRRGEEGREDRRHHRGHAVTARASTVSPRSFPSGPSMLASPSNMP